MWAERNRTNKRLWNIPFVSLRPRGTDGRGAKSITTTDAFALLRSPLSGSGGIRLERWRSVTFHADTERTLGSNAHTFTCTQRGSYRLIRVGSTAEESASTVSYRRGGKKTPGAEGIGPGSGGLDAEARSPLNFSRRSFFVILRWSLFLSLSLSLCVLLFAPLFQSGKHCRLAPNSMKWPRISFNLEPFFKFFFKLLTKQFKGNRGVGG